MNIWSGFRKKRFPRLSVFKELWALALVLILLQLLSIFFLKGKQENYLNLGLVPQELFKGKVWTLFTHSLLHDPHSWGHLLCNLIALLVLGGRISFILGRRDSAVLLLGGILCGAFIHLIEQSFFNEQSILIGLSGGLFSLLAALTTLSPDSRFWPLGIRGIHLRNGILLTSLFFILTNPHLNLPLCSELGRSIVNAFGNKIYYFSHSCHLGGLLFGWAYGHWKLRLPKLPKTFFKKNEI